MLLPNKEVQDGNDIVSNTYVIVKLRLSIKKMFPVKRPGDYKRADWGLFFSFLNFFFHIIFYYFSHIKRKKIREKNGPPDWSYF